MLHPDRLREVALGRTGLQLHDGLARPPRLPDAPRLDLPLAVRAVPDGWLLEAPSLPGRAGLAVRACDSAGEPVRVTGPFRDRHDRHLWCGVLPGPVLVPTLGLPACVDHLDVRLLRLGRGPARALGATRLDVPPPEGRPWADLAWLEPVLVLAIAVVHADGLIRDAEIRALRGLLEALGASPRTDLDPLLARPTPFDLGPASAAARLRLAGWGPRSLLEHLARVAVSTGAPPPAVRETLHEIARHLDAPAEAVERLLAGWEGGVDRALPGVDEAWRTLGVPPGSPPKAIKRAWRDAVRRHHPDRFSDAAPAAREAATQHTARLNAAYRVLLENHPSGRPAPPRACPPEDAVERPIAPPPARRERLTSVQIGMGFLAVALLATAVGLAWNGHVEQALAAVAPVRE